MLKPNPETPKADATAIQGADGPKARLCVLIPSQRGQATPETPQSPQTLTPML